MTQDKWSTCRFVSLSTCPALAFDVDRFHALIDLQIELKFLFEGKVSFHCEACVMTPSPAEVRVVKDFTKR